MNEIKFYKYIIFGLVVLNIFVLAFFLLNKQHPRHHSPPRKFQSEVVEILHLDQQQTTAFTTLAHEHRREIDAISKQQERLLLPYFERLIHSDDNIDTDSILNQFQRAEMEKIEMTYRHFQEIKEILTEEQLPDFERLIERMTRRILSGEKKRSPPPKDFN